MYKLKDALRRGVAFAAAGSMLGATLTAALPARLVSADALNPLTERSLMLSSSSPGYHYLDGSGNAEYAPPGSGNNGLKTGETFSFKVSTDTTGTGIDTFVKGWSFQYCTKPAGECTVPGNFNESSPSPSTTSNLNINYTTPTEGALNDFTVTIGGVASTGWTMHTDRVLDHPVPTNPSGTENNYITLEHATGVKMLAGTQVVIKFNASDTNYITNPGSSAFFVKVNNYDSDDYANHFVKTIPAETNTHIIDGGVTVANVMNDSIWLQTKVLETMYFSVGTVNPDTVVAPLADEEDEESWDPQFHGTCDAIEVNEPLKMGDPNAEDSLSVETAYDQYSYWRLSSNSSNGATVYYSGNTLSNTVGDQIDGIGDEESVSHTGQEQFGLALDTTLDDYDTEHGPDGGDGSFSANTIAPLLAYNGDNLDINGGALPDETDYSNGAGTIVDDGTAKFAFVEDSLTEPVPFATFDDDIINCSTGKMRYLANIAPDTPAGVYTSKINYIASPQY